MIEPLQQWFATSKSAVPVEWTMPVLVLALLVMAVVIGMFWYLNRRAKQLYFGLWTVAWSCYGLYLLISVLRLLFSRHPFWTELGYCAAACSALFMAGGGLQRARRLMRHRVAAGALATVVMGCLAANFFWAQPFWWTWLVFAVLGGVGMYTGILNMRGHGSSPDSRVLGVGLALWGGYIMLLPVLEWTSGSLAVSYLVAAVLAVLIVIAMVLEQGLSAADASYAAVFDAASDAMFLVDPWRLTIERANRAAERLTKLPLEALTDKPFGDICPDLDRQPINPAENEKLYRSVVRPQERIYVQMAGGARLTCEGDLELVQWRQRPFFQISLRDVGDRIKMSEQLRRKERLSAVGQLVAGVAHELNNPLAIISGNAQLLVRRNHLDSGLRKDLEVIYKQSERASQIVRDLLTYARPSEPTKTPVQLNRIVTTVLEWRRAAFEEAGIQVETHLAPNLPLTKADCVQVEQVLNNLLSNAIDAVQMRPQPRRIVVSTEETPTCLRMSVRDNGPGVPAEIAGKIYDPFFTTKPVGRGTGLGLAICNTYVQEHRGKLWVESQPGQGACFFVDWPLIPCDGEKPVEARPAAVPEPQATTQAKRRLLIVDDEPGIVSVLETILGEFGYQTKSANNGEQALAVLKEEQFDGILSDIRMPSMDGQTFYERLRESAPAMARRIIFITGDTVSAKTRAFLDATGNLWLTKPFQMSDVIKRVQTLLDGPQLATAGAHNAGLAGGNGNGDTPEAR